MSKIREAMRKAEQESRPEAAAGFAPGTKTPPPGGPLGLVPSLPPEVLAYHEAIGKQVEVALGATETRALVFTGALAHEGVSTILSQFAEMLSRRGESVLLIDGNARNPSLHRHFHLPDAPGLAEFVSGSASRDGVVHRTGFANLSLVPLGRCGDRSQAESVTAGLGAFVEHFKREYDYVLVDTDYVGSPFLSQSAVSAGDGVVFVIRSGKTNRQVAGRACDTVRKIGGRILGVVLNRREFPIPEFIYRRL